ncbi:MAG TPA: phosphohistidine phosphatase SixA [Verrucomicrobiae bacterium]
MNLYILRHGIAAEPGAEGCAKDSDRPLTPKGRRKLRGIAEAMKVLELKFDLILASPYLRARQTAEIVAKVLRCARRLEFTEILVPSANPANVVEFLCRLTPPLDDLLLVGHDPFLSELASLLISGNRDVGLVLKKGGLCKLVCESPKPGRSADLEWLLTPKQLLQLK